MGQLSDKRNKKVAVFFGSVIIRLKINEMPNSKNYPSLSIRTSDELEKKIERAMKLSGEKVKSKLVTKALVAGLDLLEASGWDLQKAYINQLVSPTSKTAANSPQRQRMKALDSTRETRKASPAAITRMRSRAPRGRRGFPVLNQPREKLPPRLGSALSVNSRPHVRRHRHGYRDDGLPGRLAARAGS